MRLIIIILFFYFTFNNLYSKDEYFRTLRNDIVNLRQEEIMETPSSIIKIYGDGKIEKIR